ESATTRLTVHHDRRSYEISVDFRRNAWPSESYSLADMLDAMGAPARGERSFFQASEPVRVVDCVSTIARLLTAYGRAILAGDAAAFDRLEETRRKRDTEHTRTIVADPIRQRADEAWKRHDYATVRDLYQSIEDALTAVEKERLRYARKR